MRNRAFTLIELLVVIAIIAVLAAILFPVFQSAKAAAKNTACLSNFKQVGTAIQLYLGDSDGVWFPASKVDPLEGFAPQRMWIGYDNNNHGIEGGYYGRVQEPAENPPRPGCIDPYLKSEGVKRCPSMDPSRQLAFALNGFRPDDPSEYYDTHPEAKGKEFSPASKEERTIDGLRDSIGASESEIDEPAGTLAAWEHLARVPICNFLQPQDWFGSPPQAQVLREHFSFLHNGGTNTLWCDSHAKRMNYGSLRRPMFSVRKDIY
jgi:prepilin-type N-terminal cleavage/methylation domain-containing protein/prepilin-type processing-associated H-X9-DG protein